MCVPTLSNNKRVTEAAAASLSQQQNFVQVGIGLNKFFDSREGERAVKLNAP